MDSRISESPFAGGFLRSRILSEWARVAVAFVLIMGAITGTYELLEHLFRRLDYIEIVPAIMELLIGAFMIAQARQLRRISPDLAGPWSALAAAVLLYAAGDLVWISLQLSGRRALYPSLADVFYLAYIPTFAIGAVRLVRRGIPQRGRWNVVLDLITIFVTGGLVLWNVLVGPIVEASAGGPSIEQLILLSYPVADLALLGTLLLIMYYQTDESEICSTLVLVAAMLTMFCTDFAYAYQSAAATLVKGGVLDTGWLAANLLTGLAVIPQLRYARAGEAWRNARAQPGVLETLGTLRTYLPYGALLIAYILLLRAGIASLPMSPLSLGLGVGAIVALVLLRQVTTHTENAALTELLVSKASELENSNRFLAVEVTERRRIEEKLSYDALHDNMTGLPNRTLFLERLSQAIGLSRLRGSRHSFAVLFIDIDHFKIVNDSLGHRVGDEVLWAIGARLKGTLRPTDTLARFGGDEFAILMDVNAHEGLANALADRVQRSLQQAFRVEGHELHMSASIGIVGNVAEYEQAEDLLRDADLAMYEAKSQGKSRFQSFAVGMRKRAVLRLDTEAELRQALVNNELEVHYQPILSLGLNQIVGLEALVRWRHPTRGIMRPSEFLNVAEESGLILRLGSQVLGTACMDMQNVLKAYPALGELGVSVNVSNKEFTQPGLVSAVSAALRQSGLPPRCLRLEITEKVLIGNLRLANRLFEELKGMGIRFDIDDFGTGYSALAYLQDYPIHALKIDRSFTDGMRRSRKSVALARAIVTMAHELGMRAVAEGISSKAQLQDLMDLKCDYGQGSLLSRPLTISAIERLLAQTSRSSGYISLRLRPANRSSDHSKAAGPARTSPARRRQSRKTASARPAR